MAVVRRIGVVLAAVAAVLAVVPAFLPSSYRVERVVEIRARPATIHRLVGDLEAWERWTPWRDADPTLRTSIEVPSGPGARMAWTGDSGDGTIAFTASEAATGVRYDMTFGRGRHASRGALRYESAGDLTTVTWTMEGEAEAWLGRYFSAATDRMVGPMFEDGLARLKAAAESLPEDPPRPEGGGSEVSPPDAPSPGD